MKHHMRKLFVPQKSNDYRPHFFRSASVAIMAFVILLVAILTFTGGTILQRTDLLAEIRTAFLIDLVNEDRTKEDLHSLVKNPILTQAAALKAKHMVEEGYFDHTSPEGVKPWDWLEDVGYDYAYAGENLAIHFVDSEKVHTAWMNSPTHRANILQDKFTEIGIATVEGTFNGYQTTFVVQMFGRPRATSVASRDVSLVRDVNAWVAENYLTRLLGPLTGTEKFEAGDRVRVDARRLNVRRLPGGTRIDQVNAGAVGTVVSGPQTARGLAWYNVDFYDETTNLLTRAEEATVLGETVTTEDEERLAGPGISLFASRVASDTEAAPIVTSTEDITYTSFWQRWFLNPYSVGHNIFILLASIIALALAILVGIEIRKQNFKHILTGSILFIILVGLIIASVVVENSTAVLVR